MRAIARSSQSSIEEASPVTESGIEQECLWRTADRLRSFIIPASLRPPMGTFRIRAFNGEETTADERWLRRFEVSEQEARDWAKRELGDALDELKGEIDTGLASARA